MDRRGNVLELLEDIQELRPTIFSSVPRLWNRIYDKVMAQVRPRPIGRTARGRRPPRANVLWARASLPPRLPCRPSLACTRTHARAPTSRTHARAQIQAANPVSRSLFNTAYRYKQVGGRAGGVWVHGRAARTNRQGGAGGQGRAGQGSGGGGGGGGGGGSPLTLGAPPARARRRRLRGGT